MKAKTSITLSVPLLVQIDRMIGEGASRSAYIEKVLRDHLRDEEREAAGQRDLELINAAADRLNAEMEEVLADQDALYFDLIDNDKRCGINNASSATGSARPVAISERITDRNWRRTGMTDHDKNDKSKDSSINLVNASRELDLQRAGAYNYADFLEKNGLNEISDKVRKYANKTPSEDDFHHDYSWVNYMTPKDDLALNQCSSVDRVELLKRMEDLKTARQKVYNIEFATAQRSNRVSQSDGGYPTTIPNE